MEYPVRLMFADILLEAGIDHVFGMPGGNTPFIFDGLVDKKDQFKITLARHEGGAAVMADVHARITGKPAVLIGQGPWIGTSGGYGIIESYFSGLPMIIICDTSDYNSLPQFGPYQNSTGDYGAIDLPNMMRGMTKFSTVATNGSEFLHGLQLAIKHATTGRPGPAAVLIRWNVPFENIDPETISPKFFPISGYLKTSPPCISDEDAKAVADLLVKAQKPVIIAGQGVRSAKAYNELQALAELLGIPVATTFLGKSSIPETHDCAVGTMGQIGQKIANEKITNADVILAVGTCLAPDNTKYLAPDFIDPTQQKIVQIDIESLNAGWTYPLEMGITSDAKLALRKILDIAGTKSSAADSRQRIADLKKAKAEASCFNEADLIESDNVPIMPERVVGELSKLVGKDDLVVLDGGNNRMWMTHHFQTKSAGQLLAGGGCAAVGYGPPAAIGAQITRPKNRVICVSGDGGMTMQLYALEMARDMNLPITFVILNNSCLGNVRDFQAPDRRIATSYSTTNFSNIAKGFDIDGVRVEDPGKLARALKTAMNSKKPAVVEVIVSDEPHFRLMT